MPSEAIETGIDGYGSSLAHNASNHRILLQHLEHSEDDIIAFVHSDSIGHKRKNSQSMKDKRENLMRPMDELIVDHNSRIDNMKRNSEISMGSNQLVFRSPKNNAVITRANIA